MESDLAWCPTYKKHVHHCCPTELESPFPDLAFRDFSPDERRRIFVAEVQLL
jgi:hypothetical protein